jgi:Icc-related predicted phosphoesterase
MRANPFRFSFGFFSDLASHQRFKIKLRSVRILAPHDIRIIGGEIMEKEILDKLGSEIILESFVTSKKNQTKHFNESSIWKYLDYTHWIPGEIEVEEEINKDFDR